jgi:sugar lactone lactonase YvrE
MRLPFQVGLIAVAVLWPAHAAGQDYTISTIAGGSPPVTPAPATSVSLSDINGVAADASGNVYISSWRGNCVYKVDAAGTLTVAAGNSRWGHTGDGGPATNAQFRFPYGLAVDGAGNLYIADNGNNAVRRVSPAGVITAFAGTGLEGSSGDGGPATSARLYRPWDVAVDAAGNVYIADAGNSRIRRVSPAGIITTVPGTTGQYGFYRTSVAVDSAGNVYYPEVENNIPQVRRASPAGTVSIVATGVANIGGLAVDGSGLLYISDRSNHRVLRQVGPNLFSPVAGTGTAGYSGDGGSSTSAQLSGPGRLAIDGAGRIFIADAYNHRIRRLVPSGGMVYSGVISTVAGNGLDHYSGDGGPATSAQIWPDGLAADPSGNIYFADSRSFRVRRVSPSGIVTTVAGNGTAGDDGDGGPATSAKLWEPGGVALDGAGNLYIVDGAANRVRRVSPSGIITAVAGSGFRGGFSGDGGPATSAKLNYPLGAAVDGAGNLYIADAGNIRVRRVSPSGTISTFAGTGTSGYSGDGGPATSAQFRQVIGVAADQSGNVYVLDKEAGCVRRISPGGIITTVASQLDWPLGIAVDGAGNLYVTEGDGNRVRRVANPSTQPVMSTIAGDGTDQYSGDGGPAAAAQVHYPADVAVDGSGRVYVSTGNAIRMLTPANTCAASAFPNALSAPAAGGPQNIAIQAAAGCAWTVTGLPAWVTASMLAGTGPANVALTVQANPGAARSETFTAAGTAITITQAAGGGCNYSVNVAGGNVPAPGGTVTLDIQTAAGCAWTVGGLPAWISASAIAGAGPATVTLTVQANAGAARSANITAAGTAVIITQAAGGGGVCTYAINPSRQTFTAAAGAGSIAVSTTAGCAWSAGTAAAWVTITSGGSGSGNGTVKYEVLANPTAAVRPATILVAGLTFSIEQQAQAAPAPVAAGTMAQVASGADWKTTFTLVNNGTAPAIARLTFTAGTGADLVLPLSFPQTGAAPIQASSLERTLGPGATLIVESEGPVNQAVQQGWAQLFTDGAVTGFAVFCQRAGQGEQEAVVPLEVRASSAYVLAFDNTGGFETGVAVANLNPQAGSVTVAIMEDVGTNIQTTRLDLPARGHVAFQLSSLYPATVRKRGIVEFRTQGAGQISVLGLRFNPKGSFTTIPVMAK